MRPYDGYYDDFDSIDDVGYQGGAAIRRLIEESRREDSRRRSHYRFGPGSEWDEDWDDYSDTDDDYADYDEDEFDRYGDLR